MGLIISRKEDLDKFYILLDHLEKKWVEREL